MSEWNSDPGDNGRAVARGSSKADRKRSLAEWISLSISLILLGSVVGLVFYEHITDRNEPVTIDVRPQLERVRQSDGVHYLPLEIANTGTTTAEDVIVEVELMAANGEQERAGVTVRFLPGGGTHRATVVFRSNPLQSSLKANARSFIEP